MQEDSSVSVGMESSNSEDLEEYEVIENLVNKLRVYIDNKNSEGVEGLHKFFKDNIPPKITKDVLREASMLCDNKNISLDIVKCLLEYYPEGISISDCYDDRDHERDAYYMYPLHVACKNKHCSSDIINLLIERHPAALRHISKMDQYRDSGPPLHFYLHYRPFSNMDMELVSKMIKDFPESMTANDSVDLEIAEKFAWYLKEYCDEKTDEFSLEGLRQRIDQIPKIFIQDVSQEKLFVQDVLREASMLCGSKNVSIDMIRCLLEYFPEGISSKIFDTAYPLHFACGNEHCPHDVIQLLVDVFPGALRVSSAFEGGFIATGSTSLSDDEDDNKVSGLPLHYYVSRSSPNIDRETVFMLVNHYPESMTKACEDTYTAVTPIDILIETDVFGFSELTKYCETGNMTVEATRKRIKRIPKDLFFSEICDLPEHLNLLQLVCSNENVTLEVVEYLLETYDSDGAGRTVNTEYMGEDLAAYPLHCACMNSSCPDSVIQLLITRYPNALRKVAVINEGVGVDHPISKEVVQDRGFVGGLPLHYYLGRDENIDLDTVKIMLQHYPESLTATVQDLGVRYVVVFTLFDVIVMNQQHIMNSFDVAQLLLETNNQSIRFEEGVNYSALHIACSSFKMDPRIIKLIISTCPELISRFDYKGDTAVHTLCKNRSLPDNVAVEILQLLIEKDPSSLQIMNENGRGQLRERMLPIHVAAEEGRSKHICKVLYNADKESITVRGGRNRLPLHIAATHGHYATVKCLFDLDPSTIDTRDRGGNLFFREASVENRSQATKVFLEAQWLHFMKAKNKKSLTVRDEVGQVPLHHALCSDNVSLGSIKLLLDAHSDSLFIADNDGTLPFHVACGFSSSDIVEYLTNHFTVSSFGSNIKDMWGNTPLHYACRYGKLDTVKLLLEKQEYIDSVSVRNDDGKLPIQLLCEAPRLGLRMKIDRESTEYTETIWLLLRCCPETVVNW